MHIFDEKEESIPRMVGQYGVQQRRTMWYLKRGVCTRKNDRI